MNAKRRQTTTTANKSLQLLANKAKRMIHARIPLLDTLKHLGGGNSHFKSGRNIMCAVRADSFELSAFVERFITKFERGSYDTSKYASYELSARGTGGIVFVELELLTPHRKEHSSALSSAKHISL